MDTALTTTDFGREKLNLIKQTVAKGASDIELELFLHACKRTGLDPLMKQIHAVKRWDSQAQRETMSIQTGIDGYRLIADRTGNYAPGRETAILEGGMDYPHSATAYVKKRTPDGIWHEISATAYWSEYVQKKKDGTPTSMWQKMPRLMLGKCAEALALRKAFPAELSGVYTHEEMMQADNEPKAVDVHVVQEKYPSLPDGSHMVGGPAHNTAATGAPVVATGADVSAPPAENAAPNYGVFIWEHGKKFKGYQIVDIPFKDLEWFSSQDHTPEDHVEAALVELDRRRKLVADGKGK